MSPAAMYSLARLTLAMNSSCEVLACTLIAWLLPVADQPSGCLCMPLTSLRSRASMSASGAVVGFARRFGPHVGGGDDVQLVPQVIESQQAVVKGEDAIGQLQIVLGGAWAGARTAAPCRRRNIPRRRR